MGGCRGSLRLSLAWGVLRAIWRMRPAWLNTPGIAPLAVEAFALVVVGSASASIPCGYEVTGVIQAPPCGQLGAPPTRALDVSEAGEVVGFFSLCHIGPSVPFVWTKEAGLVTLKLPPGSIEGIAAGIDNETGWIVGSTDGPGTDGPFATVWEDGEPVILGTLPGGDFSDAFASSRGRVVGQWGNEVTGPLQAFLLEFGRMIDLGPDLGTRNGAARGVNVAGQVTGWMGHSFLIDSRAFIWQGGEVTVLDAIPGGFTSDAEAISDSGHVVGAGIWIDPDTDEEYTRAFHWAGGTMVNLGTLPGFLRSAALDVSNSGVVVGRLWGGIGETGFVWFDGAMVDLNTLVSLGNDVEIRNSLAISNTGQIVASGEDAKGGVMGLLLTPIDPRTGDLTCDGSVSQDDFWLLLDAWGPCTPHEPCSADLDGDGQVGIVDFLLLLANWTGQAG